MKIPFTKLDGTGNDFVLVDAQDARLATLRGRWREMSLRLCNRQQGIGADGLLVMEPSRRAATRMRIFNPDGSEPSMCGNGIRCLAWYANQEGKVGRQFAIETKAGIRHAEIVGTNRVRIDMGVPKLRQCLPASQLGFRGLAHVDLIDSGVPHLVCWVEDISRVRVAELGRRLRRHRRFAPQGTNVDFAQIVRSSSKSRQAVASLERCRVQLRTYERGVEGETQACGTGAVATAAALVHQALVTAGRRSLSGTKEYDVEIHVPGGLLRVELSARQRQGSHAPAYGHAFLEGDVIQVTRGIFSWDNGGAV